MITDNIIKLSKRELDAVKDISKYTTKPTRYRHGYSKRWTPKTNQKLYDKGLVKFVYNSVVITELGLKLLTL